MTVKIIGELPFEKILIAAKEVEKLGGCLVPLNAKKLADLALSGPREIRIVTHNLNTENGSILMSSGGTTGAPKLTYVNFDMGINRTFEQWKPFEKTDVMLNLFNAGRLWGSHYYIQGLAEKGHCTVIPAGPFKDDEIRIWLPILLDVGMNTIAGNPTGIADFGAGHLKHYGPNLSVKKIIWLAESWSEQKLKITKTAFPNAKFWGNYGSVETFIIATSTPTCDLGTLHLLPDQLLELDDEGALLTRVGNGWSMPTVRYRLGDKIKFIQCTCGRPYALKVESRADDSFNLRSNKISINKILDTINSIPEVDASQIILVDHDGAHQSVDVLIIKVVGNISNEKIKTALFKEIYVLDEVFQAYPDSINIFICDELE